MKAVGIDRPDVVQLLDNYGHQRFQFFDYLRCAVIRRCAKVLEYLLSKYKHPVNQEYVVNYDGTYGNKIYQTLLVEACSKSVKLVELLLEHGADPNHNYSSKVTCPNVIATAIADGQVEMVAQSDSQRNQC